MSNKLLPYPCCGSDKVEIVAATHIIGCFVKKCDLESGQNATIEGATRKWNTCKPVEWILGRLKKEAFDMSLENPDCKAVWIDKAVEIVKKEIN